MINEFLYSTVLLPVDLMQHCCMQKTWLETPYSLVLQVVPLLICSVSLSGLSSYLNWIGQDSFISFVFFVLVKYYILFCCETDLLIARSCICYGTWTVHKKISKGLIHHSHCLTRVHGNSKTVGPLAQCSNVLFIQKVVMQYNVAVSSRFVVENMKRVIP